jgi:hypothetical protein
LVKKSKESNSEETRQSIGNKDMGKFVSLAMVHKIPQNKSDDNPLISKLNNEHVKLVRYFRYELYLKNEEECLDMV